jgi:hypothetical protein
MKWLLALLAATTVALSQVNPARAVELLTGGDMEPSLVGWTITESATGGTGSADTTEQTSGANQPMQVTGEAGIFLKPWAGGSTSTQLNDGIISQTVAGTAGENYTFSGWSKWEGNYSGGVDVLFFTSPHDPGMTGTVPSPTQTTFQMEFLNGSAVIGAPVMLDLRTEQSNDQTWRQHMLSGVAPAGTTNIRVSAAMLDGVFNRDPLQSAFFDNFSLTAASAPTTEKLINGDWNQLPSLTPEWTLTELPADGTNTASFAGFANHTPGGSNGLWLRAFEGNTTNMGADAILSQTVDAVPNSQYTFSGWSKWEGNYSGGVTTLSAASPFGAVASPTQTTLELAFLDAGDNVIGAPVTLDLRTVQMNDSTWRQHTLMANSPANAAKVRVTAAAIDMVFNTDPQQSAFFDDFSLDGPGGVEPVPGDRDGDNDVDGNDFILIQRGLGSTTTAADFATWKANYGRTSALGSFQAIPEPATAVGAVLACLALAAARRRPSRR